MSIPSFAQVGDITRRGGAHHGIIAAGAQELSCRARNSHALAQGFSRHGGRRLVCRLVLFAALYVYHADAEDAVSLRRFEIMERRLFAIMSIGALAALGLGAAMLAAAPAYLAMGGCGSNCWWCCW